MPALAETMRPRARPRAAWWPRLLAGAVLLGLLAAGVIAIRVWPGQVQLLTGRLVQIERSLGSTGWLLAAGVQTLVALCGVLPASIGAFAAGAAYGIAGGFAISGTATILGAILAFVLARRLFRPLAERIVARHPRMARLDEAVTREGWRLVVLLRLSPVMPFALTSYALGLTSLGLRGYVVGTFAALPALLGYVAIGHLTRLGVTSLSTHAASPLRWSLLTLALAATVLLTLLLARIVRLVFVLPEPPAETIARDVTPR